MIDLYIKPLEPLHSTGKLYRGEELIEIKERLISQNLPLDQHCPVEVSANILYLHCPILY